MNRDKQIEEMSGDIEVVFNYGYVDFNKTAEKLIAKGYRKASDVAREIFADIESNIYPMLGLENDKEYVAILSTTFAELKKKYE